jgi:hypothetical protein
VKEGGSGWLRNSGDESGSRVGFGGRKELWKEGKESEGKGGRLKGEGFG